MTNKLILMRSLVYPWIKVKVGNGERTYFWSSNWSPYGHIKDYLRADPSASLGIPRASTLAELWEYDHWALPAARSDSQVRVISYLTSLVITDQEDELIWCPNDLPSGKYSTKLIYNIIRDQGTHFQWLKEIWFGGGIPKHKFLAWLMMLNRCPTKDRMLHWGLPVDASCALCQAADESRNHLFFRCCFSWDLWAPLAARCSITPTREWETTLLSIQTYSGTRQWKKLLLLCWQATIYHIWVERNQRLHRNHFRSVDSIVHEIDKMIRLRIASYRFSNPAESSSLLQLWFSSSQTVDFDR